jgi:hypothetical protein
LKKYLKKKSKKCKNFKFFFADLVDSTLCDIPRSIWSIFSAREAL